MYSSLDRIDIIGERDGGVQVYTQIDHRTAQEIEANRHLSIIFALIKVLNAQPHRKNVIGGDFLHERIPSGDHPFVVEYHAKHMPPEFLHQAIASAGGELSVDGEIFSYPIETADVEELADLAFSGLAGEVAKSHGLEFTLEGLSRLEAGFAANIPDEDTDTSRYWTEVVHLGAFCGEVLRSKVAGLWKYGNLGALPFVFEAYVRREEAKITPDRPLRGSCSVADPLGKATKFFKMPESDSLVDWVTSERWVEAKTAEDEVSNAI